MEKKKTMLICGFLLALSACGGGGGDSSGTGGSAAASGGDVTVSSTFAKGADVSWVTEEEAAGKVFSSSSGVATDPFVLLKNLGTNAIRLRVWVDPVSGWNGKADVLAKARRAAALGMRLMIDFHYSDTWADPAHQTKPAAWEAHSVSQLKDDVYAHTYDVLNTLKNAGLAVEWVQVGNEINSGMLWPEGKYTDFAQLAGLVNSGYAASKAVYPDAKVVLHLANGQDNAVFRWFFDAFKAAGGNWDVTGMSLYPGTSDWQTYTAKLSTNMADVVSRYGKPVVIAEIGMDWQQGATAKAFVADVMTRVAALGDNGLGVFYWEPEGWPSWNGYTMGALNNSGQFTEALDPY